MATPEHPGITGAVEGDVNEAVVRCLIENVNAKTLAIYGRNGKSHLHRRLPSYNQAARLSPWIVLVDLDLDAECAPPFRESWLPKAADFMCFRVAVRAVESWLMADKERFSRFLGVDIAIVPRDVEAVTHPKRTVVELAKRSRKREIREDMVPRVASGRTVGPAYTARLIEFVIDGKIGWRPEIAAGYSESLKRCLRSLRRLREISA